MVFKLLHGLFYVARKMVQHLKTYLTKPLVVNRTALVAWTVDYSPKRHLRKQPHE